MNKLKTSLALIALMIPLLVCAKGRRIELQEKLNKHRSIVEVISVEAFIDDFNKELTIEFSEEWEPVTIEIKSKEGCIVYSNLYMPTANSTLSISLGSISGGDYILTISDEKVMMTGEFMLENQLNN